jgi:hypothetical protein
MMKSAASSTMKATYSLRLSSEEVAAVERQQIGRGRDGRASATISLLRFFSQKWARKSGTTAMTRR